MRRFFLIFLVLWLILPLFGWRSLSVFGWAKGGGVSISECVDTLNWQAEWDYGGYNGWFNADTYFKRAKGLTSVGNYQVFSISSLFFACDSIYIDSLILLYHWGGVPSDTDTVLFSIDTLKAVSTNEHYYYVYKSDLVLASGGGKIYDVGYITQPLRWSIRIWRKSGTHALYQAGIVVFYKKYK